MFDAIGSDPPVPLQQSDAFLRAVRKMGGAVTKVDFGAGSAVMQVRQTGPMRLGLISRGPSFVCRSAAESLADALRQRRHPVLINAEVSTGFAGAGFLNVMTPATVARLRLAKDLQACMHQKWRNRLRKAENGPLKVVRTVFPDDVGHWLLQAEAVQRRARGYRGLHPAFAVAFRQANGDAAQLFVANLRGAPVAGMLFLRHGAAATYHIGHTTNAGRALNAHTLLLARAAKWFAGRGVEVLDLGALDTVSAPGLARFKLGIGAEAHALGGTWLYQRHLATAMRALQVQTPSAAARMLRMFSP